MTRYTSIIEKLKIPKGLTSLTRTKPKLKMSPPRKLASLMKMGIVKNTIRAALKKHEGIYDAINAILSGATVAEAIDGLVGTS